LPSEPLRRGPLCERRLNAEIGAIVVALRQFRSVISDGHLWLSHLPPLFLSFDASIDLDFSTDKAFIFLDRHHYDDGVAVLFDENWVGASGIEQSPRARHFTKPSHSSIMAIFRAKCNSFAANRTVRIE
jgi:hypothetical protein